MKMRMVVKRRLSGIAEDRYQIRGNKRQNRKILLSDACDSSDSIDVTEQNVKTSLCSSLHGAQRKW